MKPTGKQLLIALVMGGMLAGCDSGDVNIQPVTEDNSVDNSVNNSNNTSTTPTTDQNPCASYVNSGGQTIQGTFDGLDCSYSPSFVDAGNNLMVDMTIPALEDGGVHIFQGSLFVGESYDSNAELAAAGIAEGGDGPVLTVEAGATLAFQSQQQFVIINRGSQLFAVGTEANPITFTSVSDVESQRAVAAGGEATLAFDAVQQWGGMVINGFGISNRCEYTGALEVDSTGAVIGDGDIALAAGEECHVDAEGAAGLDESQYGGANNDDSSGRLEYVRVKHTGAEVANGDELNGISFGGVGRNTVIRNLEVYSTYDDGIEMFGGAVNFENFVALYVRDDSIDIDEGYSGTITNALVIQAEADGNHCIESDGIASFDGNTRIEEIISQNINSRPVIRNLTCIISPNGPDTATHDPGAGWRFREGIYYPELSDSLLIAIGADDPTSDSDNYGVRIDNRSLQAAEDGFIDLVSNIIAVPQGTRSASLPGGQTVEDFVNTQSQIATVPDAGLDPTAAADTGLQVLGGTPPVFSIDFTTMVVDGAAPAVADPASGRIGALAEAIPNWTANWTYGIYDGARGAPLWFE